MARDLLIHYWHGIQAPRATEDIDLGVAVEDWDHFDKVRQRLLASKAFVEVPGVLHQLKYQAKIRVDLVPFGGVERADGTIAWPPEGTPEMTVHGFAEALHNAEIILLPGGRRIPVTSLPIGTLSTIAGRFSAWIDQGAS
jgi:predicted nucleotidyltransferase